MHTHDGATLTSWKRVAFQGTKGDVHESIAELMRRAPWALFGFSADARAAMATGRRLDTTREIDERRVRMSTETRWVDIPRDAEGAASLEAESIHSFWRGCDWHLE